MCCFTLTLSVAECSCRRPDPTSRLPCMPTPGIFVPGLLFWTLFVPAGALSATQAKMSSAPSCQQINMARRNVSITRNLEKFNFSASNPNCTPVKNHFHSEKSTGIWLQTLQITEHITSFFHPLKQLKKCPCSLNE